MTDESDWSHQDLAVDTTQRTLPLGRGWLARLWVWSVRPRQEGGSIMSLLSHDAIGSDKPGSKISGSVKAEYRISLDYNYRCPFTRRTSMCLECQYCQGRTNWIPSCCYNVFNTQGATESETESETQREKLVTYLASWECICCCYCVVQTPPGLGSGLTQSLKLTMFTPNISYSYSLERERERERS